MRFLLLLLLLKLCAISSAQSLSFGGQVGHDQWICPGESPEEITEVIPVESDSEIEYQWFRSTHRNVWKFGLPVEDAVSVSLQAAPVYKTTWFVRKVRMPGQSEYAASSNTVTVRVSEGCASGNTEKDRHYSTLVYPQVTSDRINLSLQTAGQVSPKIEVYRNEQLMYKGGNHLVESFNLSLDVSTWTEGEYRAVWTFEGREVARSFTVSKAN